MGRFFGFSCCCCREKSEPFNGVRVIHINGHLEGFDPPITASEVTGKPPYRLLFSPIQLYSGSIKPLLDDDQLEPGRLYFLLPRSVLKAEPVDLAALANRLTLLARRSGSSKPTKGTRPPVVGVADQASQSVDFSRSRRAKPWKPVLETIRELSFKLTMERRESMKSPAISNMA